MLFVRFTRDARTAVLRAQDVARWAGHAAIGADAVGLGALLVLEESARPDDCGIDAGRARKHLRSLLSWDDALDASALGQFGIELADVRRATDESFGPGAFDRADGAARMRSARRRPPFTTGAKWLLRDSLREAESLGQSGISERHILLAGLRHSAHLREALTLDSDVASVRRALQRVHAPA
jgi:hypothetical protein